ncbi:MAG: undecaprenyldiphospho-muramoylpentapeptide beta-N-acetylglucosaminyltransferase [Oscillospiraceae bacterium]|nr:undecaprenyldiphospho-muramoylpentapeptide beta-N-acetylglucosaminyltransferase [Oscillospiraceae bacterium]
MRFLFTCGGTAGHIYPAIAVAGRIRELMPDAEILFVGARGKMETELVPREGYEIQTVQITNLQRRLSPKGILHNLGTIKNLFVSMGEAKRILKEFKPDVALGTGGYVCFPVLYQAAKLGIPTAVHESNMVPGLTTKLLASRVDRVMLGFEGAEKAYNRRDGVVYTGTPVRGAFLGLNREQARAELGIPTDKPLVVSFWGSLGASKMNLAMQELIWRNYEDQCFYQVHATGGGDAGLYAMQSALAAKGVTAPLDHGIDIRTYIYDMPKRMAAADLILCRAGASTLAELTALGKPAVLVPSPYVTHNHQEENAKALEQGGGAAMLREADAAGETLYRTVTDCLADAGRLSAMREAMKRMGNPDATEAITKIILDIMKQ